MWIHLDKYKIPAIFYEGKKSFDVNRGESLRNL